VVLKLVVRQPPSVAVPRFRHMEDAAISSSRLDRSRCSERTILTLSARDVLSRLQSFGLLLPVRRMSVRVYTADDWLVIESLPA
jgi:hypothetical protein